MLFLQFLQSKVTCLQKDALRLGFSKSVPPAATQLQPCFQLSEVKNNILAKCWIFHSLSSLRIVSILNCEFKVFQDQFKSQCFSVEHTDGLWQSWQGRLLRIRALLDTAMNCLCCVISLCLIFPAVKAIEVLKKRPSQLMFDRKVYSNSCGDTTVSITAQLHP